MKTPHFFNGYSRTVLLFFLVVFSYSIGAQIRLVEVDPTSDTVTIQNFGSSTVPINNYWFCTLFAYDQLDTFTIKSGSLNLAPEAKVTLSGLNLRDSDADLGLYSTDSFGSATAIVDFIQWGDAGNGRESVANTANIWTTGDFLTIPGPFVYNGNGNENGLAFWSTGTLSINNEIFSSKISVYPNPVRDNLNITSLEGVELKNVTLFNTTGSLIRLHNKGIQNIMDLKDLQSGFYTLRLIDVQGRTAVRKIIKN